MIPVRDGIDTYVGLRSAVQDYGQPPWEIRSMKPQKPRRAAVRFRKRAGVAVVLGGDETNPDLVCDIGVYYSKLAAGGSDRTR